MLKRLRNKRGSSAVMLGMAFVSFALCIAGAITICRSLVVKSECEAFGRVWTRAVLSEYDEHLLDDYNLMAYWGLDQDIEKTLWHYVDYSLRDKLGLKFADVNVNLAGTELSDPENMRKAMRDSGLVTGITKLISNNKRIVISESDDEWGKLVIRNRFVINNRPSKGIRSSLDINGLKDAVNSITSVEGLAKGRDSGMEIAFIYSYLGSHNKMANSKKTLLRNEWEYILNGNLDDEKNYKVTKRNLFILRNALNLLYLHKDPVKEELILSAAELITPGPAGVATAALIREAWAALEAEEDIKTLAEGGRIPIMKTEDTWQTDLDSVLSSRKLKDKLDDEARKNLEKNRSEMPEGIKSGHSKGSIIDGLDYEEYLLILLSAMNERVRLLRIMDIISFDMKYRYYEDFNMDEYHTGVAFTIKANGRDYEFSDAYK